MKRFFRRSGDYTPLFQAFRSVVTRPFVKDTGVIGAATNARLLLGLAQAILVARWLGPESYGKAVLIMAAPELMFGLVDARTSEAVTRYLQRFKVEARDKAAAVCRLGFLVDLGLSILALILVFALAKTIAGSVIEDQGTRRLMLLYAGSFIVRSIAPTCQSLLVVEKRWGTLAGIEFSSALIRTGSVLAMVAGGAGIEGVVAGNILFGIVRAALMSSAAQRSARNMWGGHLLSGRARDISSILKEIGRFMFLTDLAGLIAVMTKQADVLLVGAVAGVAPAGYYRMAKNLPGLWTLVGEPLQLVAYQRLTDLSAKNDPTSIRELIRRFTLKIGVPLASATLLTILLVPFAVRITVGPAYAPAIDAARIFVASSAVGALFFWLRPLHLALGEPGVWAAGNFLVSIVFLLLGVGFLIRYGIEGLAVAFLLANYISPILLVVRQWRNLNRSRDQGLVA